jgi:hypothetical protein
MVIAKRKLQEILAGDDRACHWVHPNEEGNLAGRFPGERGAMVVGEGAPARWRLKQATN